MRRAGDQNAWFNVATHGQSKHCSMKHVRELRANTGVTGRLVICTCQVATTIPAGCEAREH